MGEDPPHVPAGFSFSGVVGLRVSVPCCLFGNVLSFLLNSIHDRQVTRSNTNHPLHLTHTGVNTRRWGPLGSISVLPVTDTYYAPPSIHALCSVHQENKRQNQKSILSKDVTFISSR